MAIILQRRCDHPGWAGGGSTGFAATLQHALTGGPACSCRANVGFEPALSAGQRFVILAATWGEDGLPPRRGFIERLAALGRSVPEAPLAVLVSAIAAFRVLRVRREV